MKSSKRKILFVAQPEAIHTARWISQLDKTEFDIHLLPSRNCNTVKEMPPLTVHSLLPITNNQSPNLKNTPCIPWPLKRGSDRLRRMFLKKYPGANEQIATLAHVINKLQPDIVHTLEMQLAGYQMLAALPYLHNRKSFSWIYSCWGNDIAFYRNDPQHLDLIRKALANIDYYTADCPRDMGLIAELTNSARPLPVFPTGGGYDLAALNHQRSTRRPSERKIIAVKGYHDDNWTGRALYSLRALEKCSKELSKFEIVVYRPIGPVRHTVQYLRAFSGLNIRCTADWEDNIDILKLLGVSRVSLATNMNDGTPNSMLESMILGAFPIQSSTADTTDWIINGKNGLLVQYDDVDSISQAILIATSNDLLVDNAYLMSEKIVASRLDRNTLAQTVNNLYMGLAKKR